jgi:hypothetical protein
MNRIATIVATAGIALFGGVALAPAASAAPVQDGPSYVIEGPGNGHGPDAFVVTDHGRIPVFFCDPGSAAHAKNCASLGDDTGGRF